MKGVAEQRNESLLGDARQTSVEPTSIHIELEKPRRARWFARAWLWLIAGVATWGAALSLPTAPAQPPIPEIPTPGDEPLVILAEVRTASPPRARTKPSWPTKSHVAAPTPAPKAPEARVAVVDVEPPADAPPVRWQTLADAYAIETNDPNGTRELQEYMRETAQAVHLDPTAVEFTECKTTVCRVQLSFPTLLDANEFREAANSALHYELRALGPTSVTATEEPSRFELYVSRDPAQR